MAHPRELDAEAAPDELLFELRPRKCACTVPVRLVEERQELIVRQHVVASARTHECELVSETKLEDTALLN